MRLLSLNNNMKPTWKDNNYTCDNRKMSDFVLVA